MVTAVSQNFCFLALFCVDQQLHLSAGTSLAMKKGILSVPTVRNKDRMILVPRAGQQFDLEGRRYHELLHPTWVARRGVSKRSGPPQAVEEEDS